MRFSAVKGGKDVILERIERDNEGALMKADYRLGSIFYRMNVSLDELPDYPLNDAGLDRLVEERLAAEQAALAEFGFTDVRRLN